MFYLFFVIAIISAIGITIHNHKSDNALTISMVTNIDDLSEEFMENYFEEYEEMRNDETSDPENMLIVVSLEEPENYGAKKIIEAPNHTYFLQYSNEAEKNDAFVKLKDDDLISVEENGYYFPDYNSWGIKKMGLDNALSSATFLETPNQVLVAVIDTGIDLDVFSSNYPNKNLSTYCVTTCVGTIDDTLGHGTAVTSVIAEGTPNNVSILAIKASSDVVINGEVNTVFYHSDIIAAGTYALDAGADVLNLSFGAPDDDVDLDAIDSYIESEGLLFNSLSLSNVINVAAAGNDGNEENLVHYPAAFDSTISVGAVRSDLNITSFSTHNEFVDFVAPCYYIRPLDPPVPWSGTSMAAPHISAAVAIIKSFNKQLNLDQVKEVLKTLAVDLGSSGKDEYYGWGFVDLSNAIFCTSRKHCDNNDLFLDQSFINNHAPDTISFSSDGDHLLITADRACMVLRTYDSVEYDALVAVATDAENSFDYFLSGDHDEVVHLYVAGDVTLNGDVNSSDALAIAKHVSGFSPLSTMEAILGDVNKNGFLNSSDALSIAKDYSGIQPIPW